MAEGLAALSPDTVLVRAPELKLRLSDDEVLRVETEGGQVALPSVALSLLAMFERPMAVGQALGSVAALGPEHFVELSEAIILLHRAGVLHVPGERPAVRARGFVSPDIHIAMLRDRNRTATYCAALAATVTPDDVVVDIGTGTGILATRAALDGAKRVFAIESSGIAEIAERVFAANAVADRVTLLRGRSTHLSLPERATVLVTEIIGNEPFHEDILEVVLDARERLLTPDARIIPGHLEIFAVPVSLPEERYAELVFTESAVESSRKSYGVDLSALATVRRPATDPVVFAATDFAKFGRVGPAIKLAEVDLATFSEPRISGAATFSFDADVRHLGVAISFRARLAGGGEIAPYVGEVDRETSWSVPVWIAPDTLPTAAGCAVRLDYEYGRKRSELRLASQPR